MLNSINRGPDLGAAPLQSMQAPTEFARSVRAILKADLTEAKAHAPDRISQAEPRWRQHLLEGLRELLAQVAVSGALIRRS